MTVAKYLSKITSSYLTKNSEVKFSYDDLQKVIAGNSEIGIQIGKSLGLTCIPENEAEGNVCMANNAEVRPEFKQSFAPIDLLDYIYAVLHSPKYREKYKEFLKIDFPRVPFPADAVEFWKLVEVGGELRQLHLLESPAPNIPNTGITSSAGNSPKPA